MMKPGTFAPLIQLAHRLIELPNLTVCLQPLLKDFRHCNLDIATTKERIETTTTLEKPQAR